MQDTRRGQSAYIHIFFERHRGHLKSQEAFEVDKITTEEQFHQQRLFFYQDINTLGITVLDMSAEDIIKAENLILTRYMRGGAAVQEREKMKRQLGFHPPKNVEQ
ncbi:MAG: hypothetical protein QMC83_10425 [Thermodesulfovibrionales bacterium]|nr:hypothetical protein [Thermodesulfovibrionales bacterium]